MSPRIGYLERDLPTNVTKVDHALAWLDLNDTRIGDLEERVIDNVSPRVDNL